jgi:AcrR family transcriptional regulator
MSDNPKKSNGRPRSIESDRAIWQATLELLAEAGFDRLSIEAIAARARVGKTTIYRRYTSKEELVADAIESVRSEVIIPDTGSLTSDLDALVEMAAQITLTPLGRRSVGSIVSSAASNPAFAQIYWQRYLEPRRQAFAVVIDRAKVRKEVKATLDPSLVFDTMSGIMLYALIFPPTDESWVTYVRRAIDSFIDRDRDRSSVNFNI